MDRIGTQLKYFSQKKDVIVIKNMLVNVQNRYQRVGTRCNEKTRELEAGLKLAKQVRSLSCKMTRISQKNWSVVLFASSVLSRFPQEC